MAGELFLTSSEVVTRMEKRRDPMSNVVIDQIFLNSKEGDDIPWEYGQEGLRIDDRIIAHGTEYAQQWLQAFLVIIVSSESEKYFMDLVDLLARSIHFL